MASQLAEAQGVTLSEMMRGMLKEAHAARFGVAAIVRENWLQFTVPTEPHDLAHRLTAEMGRFVSVDEAQRLAEACEDVEPYRGGFRPRDKRRGKR